MASSSCLLSYSKTIAKARGNPEAVEVDGVEADVVLGQNGIGQT